MLMTTKLAAATLMFVAFGLASSAQAANDNQSLNRGGIPIGPLGQCFACTEYRYPPFGRFGYGRYGFAFVPGRHYRHEREWWGR